MRPRTVIAVAAAVVVVAGGAVGTTLLLHQDETGPECVVPGRDGATALELDAVQLQHASTINAVGIARGLPERARVIALATAFQESSMRNLPDGDRDSVGLFQQRPSQGWGSVEQISDPVYAAGKFYDALVEVPDWQSGVLTEVAQAVQYSGHPDAYAKWEDEATVLADGLGGAFAPTLSCRSGASPSTAPVPQREPLAGTGSADPQLRELLAAATAELGGIELVELSDTGTATVGATADGMTPERAAAALAAWTVAHATGFGVTGVDTGSRSYRDHTWSDAASDLPAGQVRIAVGG